MNRVLAVRLDSVGDMLLTGPAIRALARTADVVDVLASPTGAPAARLLPGVDDVLVHDPAWSGYEPPPLRAADTFGLVAELALRAYRLVVVFTSFHQSPLPMAMLARLAGVPRIAAACEDYPGSLLDVRHRRSPPPGGGHEVEAALALAEAAGADPPRGAADRRLAVRRPLVGPPPGLPEQGYVVVHPGASVPARGLTPDHARAIVAAVRESGRHVVLTGGAQDATLGASCVEADAGIVDLCGRTDLATLAAVLAGAQAVVVGNTGPAHLAAAIGAPVVCLFSPVVPASRWAPYGVPCVVLGDQQAPCRDTRARDCPVPGHPCLSEVSPASVVAAIDRLTVERRCERDTTEA